MLIKCFLILGIFLAAIAIYFPGRHARHYEYVATENILKEFYFERTLITVSSQRNCSYEDITINNRDIEAIEVTKKTYFRKPLTGGEYQPVLCNPLIKSAIIVPYRNRKEQLDIFLNYMHTFLQRQNVHYRIFIVEQNDTLPFNRGKMLNYGARVAISLKYNCLILHDVDLLPLNTGNIYGCSKRPRHMSSSLDTFRFNLPYLTLFGGAIAILSDQFLEVNGMSNVFDGWGGEDDDFYKRLKTHNLLPYRFAPEISKYTMLFHKKEAASPDRFEKLTSSLERQLNTDDGVSGLSHKKYIISLEDLYTNITVNS